jgi:hypothetical protein
MKAIERIFGQLVIEAREGSTMLKAELAFYAEKQVNVVAEADSVERITEKLLRGDVISLNDVTEPDVIDLDLIGGVWK